MTLTELMRQHGGLDLPTQMASAQQQQRPSGLAEWMRAGLYGLPQLPQQFHQPSPMQMAQKKMLEQLPPEIGMLLNNDTRN